MELKKNPEADLFKKSSFYMSIGLMVSLLLTVMAFEWKSYDDNDLVNLGSLDADFEELQDIPITEQPPPPPPQVTPPEIIEVPDEEEIEEEIEVNLDVEVTEETVIEDVVFEDAPEEEEPAALGHAVAVADSNPRHGPSNFGAELIQAQEVNGPHLQQRIVLVQHPGVLLPVPQPG